MIIPGTDIANSIKESLKGQIKVLPVPPHLAVVIVGNDPSSLKYISRKKKVGEEIGMVVSIYHLKPNEPDDVRTAVKILNEDEEVNGIIIQRPVPLAIPKEELDSLIIPQKDVDGFHPQSKFHPPISEAVWEILKWVFKESSKLKDQSSNLDEIFLNWLKEKKILIIGRGETGGIPITKMLASNGINPAVAHSKTENIKEMCLSSDVIISCVGKGNIVRRDMVSKKTILIGVGMHPETHPADIAAMTFSPDYVIDEIKDRVAYYTPVPGGVGPVNVVFLLKNVVGSVKLSD